MPARSVVAGSCAIIALLVVGVTPAACQGNPLEDLGLGDLGLGGLGLGNLGALGALGGLTGGGMGGAPAKPTTIIVSQPAMLIHGNSLYIAYQGKVTKFDLDTLEKLAEATFAAPPTGAGVVHGASSGPKLIKTGPTGAKPPLLPGAVPSTGP